MTMSILILVHLVCGASSVKRTFAVDLSYKHNKKLKPEPSVLPTQLETTSAGSSSRKVVGEMFLANKLSAKDVQAIQHSNYEEGNVLAHEWARIGNFGKAPKNFARDLMRSLLKDVKMPPIFDWPIPVWNLEKNSQEFVQWPFLLPHEVCHHLVCSRGIATYQFQGPSPWKKIFLDTLQGMHVPTAGFIPLGLHGDGVPFSKTDSIEILSLNFLALPKADRVPITCVSKKHICKCGCKGRCTWDALMLVVKWSLLMLFTGVVSTFLPDSSGLLNVSLVLLFGALCLPETVIRRHPPKHQHPPPTPTQAPRHPTTQPHTPHHNPCKVPGKMWPKACCDQEPDCVPGPSCRR